MQFKNNTFTRSVIRLGIDYLKDIEVVFGLGEIRLDFPNFWGTLVSYKSLNMSVSNFL